MDTGNVIDFRAARRRRRQKMHEGSLCAHALNKCVEMYYRSDWCGFGYWHAIYSRERRRGELTFSKSRNLEYAEKKGGIYGATVHAATFHSQ